MSYDYIGTLSRESRERYEVKLTASGLEECPYRLPADSWSEDMTQWPEVTFGDLYVYLTSTPGVFTQQAMKAFKSLEAHRYFTAGFVQTVKHLKAGSVTVFRANVRPSQRANDPSHLPWVSLDWDGQVIAAHCTCMAGLGESCSHVAALLFKLEAATRLGLTTLACTSKQCEWNNFYTEKVEPAPIKDIQFYSSRAASKVECSRRERRLTAEMSAPTDAQKRSFLDTLCTADNLPVALSLFKETSCRFKTQRKTTPRVSMPASLRTRYIPNSGTMTPVQLVAACEAVINSTVVTDEQIGYVEEMTRTQASCVLWHEQRVGRITASTAHSVLHTNKLNPSPSVVKSITTLRTKATMSQSLEYGRVNEQVVFRQYQDLVEDHHLNPVLQKTGMRIDYSRPWLSASADALVKCECHGSAVVEIKCPYSARHLSPEDFIRDPLSYIFNGELSKTHRYFTQVQLQMLVYEVDACDFLTYVGDSVIHTEVLRDDSFLESVLPKLENFWKVYIVPELVTRALETTCKRVETTDENTKLYCYCQKAWDGTTVLVGCDGIDCRNEWIHLECIRPKRKTIPKGVWYCKDCKKK